MSIRNPRDKRAVSRRPFLIAGASTALSWASPLSAQAWPAPVPVVPGSVPGTRIEIACFRYDVTPPLGHSCCGGWIRPIESVDDALEARGIILLGAGKPIVICAVDWTGILNEAHQRWRQTLADAAGTTPDRVAVQCVHQHNAPMACLNAQTLIEEPGDLPAVIDREFFAECQRRGAKAVQRALQSAQRVTHVGMGQARVDRVASNRRVSRDAEGQVLAMRGSSCRVPELRALPEGLIDPHLKTIAFFRDGRRLCEMHYYATHPMSYYGDGRASSDFPGLARKQLQAEDPDCFQIYFTGCAGNVTAGKYNDGSQANRPVLVERMYRAMVQSRRSIQPVELTHLDWKQASVQPLAHSRIDPNGIREAIANRQLRVVQRNRPAYALAYWQRLQQQIPLEISSLHVNQGRLLHLPAECFVQYQLRAQSLVESSFVACAAYGDGGPWYIPVAEEYTRGGYEVSVAWSAPAIDEALTQAMTHLLT